MSKTQAREAKISELKPDQRNANKGTERGAGMLEYSLRNYGAGRSILIDKHGNVIAGNKTLEGAAGIGLEDAIIVPTDGTKLVVVQRTDLDLERDTAAKELAIVDNRAGQVSLDWDADVLKELKDEGVNLGQFWFDDELAKVLATDDRQEFAFLGDAAGAGAGGNSDSQVGQDTEKQAIPIVVNKTYLSKWLDYKQSIGEMHDTRAFEIMLDAVIVQQWSKERRGR